MDETNNQMISDIKNPSIAYLSETYPLISSLKQFLESQNPNIHDFENWLNFTQNLLSQMAPGATVKSVYPHQEKSNIKGLSQMLPAETVKSVYNKKESHTLFSQMVPGSVSKSVYTKKKWINKLILGKIIIIMIYY